MGRPRKQTVEYFPHYVSTDSRTRFILEQRWGNDGYAFWFKLLELLSKSEGHYYDYSNGANKQYLIARMLMDEKTVEEIIEVLVELGQIDSELWEKRKWIWCQNLVDNLQVLYSKRTQDLPKKPEAETKEETQPESQEPDAGAPTSADKHRSGGPNIYEQIVEIYNATCASLPKVKNISEARKSAIKARINSGYGIDNFRELFRKAEESKFLRGKNDKNWIADFDWLIKDSNMAKTLDGKYDDKEVTPDGNNKNTFQPSSGFKGW